jgi:hypothetical protein
VNGRIRLTWRFAVAAVLWQGLSGSPLIVRGLIETPAWQHLGVVSWAHFSRYADLGAGLLLYPIFGIVSWVIVLATAVSFRFDRTANRAAALPVYLAALFSLAAAVTTVIAAPIIVGIMNLSEAGAGIQEGFFRFTLWGVYARGAAFTLSFLSSVWAVVRLASNPDKSKCQKSLRAF